MDLLHIANNKFEVLRVGEKRSSHAPEVLKAKRRKENEALVEYTFDFQDMGKLNYISSERKKEYGDYISLDIVSLAPNITNDSNFFLQPDFVSVLAAS